MKSRIDQMLFAAITRGWDTRTIDRYSDSMQTRTAATPPHVERAFQTIDTKAGGLLTHVSMMIAGLGICAPVVAQSAVEEGIIIFEIAVYLLIAVGSLRCLSVFGSRELGTDPEVIKQALCRELILRQELYYLCNRAAIVFTILVFVSLPALLIWTPTK